MKQSPFDSSSCSVGRPRCDFHEAGGASPIPTMDKDNSGSTKISTTLFINTIYLCLTVASSYVGGFSIFEPAYFLFFLVECKKCLWKALMSKEDNLSNPQTQEPISALSSTWARIKLKDEGQKTRIWFQVVLYDVFLFC